MYDLIVRGARAVIDSSLTAADIAVKNGVIAAVLQPGEGTADSVLDASGCILLPGIVDMHFHCRVPGKSEREDFDTATMAAAVGGVTTLVEMPICQNSPADAQKLKARIDYAADKAVIDYGFFGAGATMSAQKAVELAHAGVMGYKIFLHSAPKGRESEFDGLCAVGSKELAASLDANRHSGLITCVHPEDDGLISAMVDRLDTVNGDCTDQIKTRVAETEELSVMTLGIIAKTLNAPVHACHLSSKQAVQAMQYLRAQGAPITAETCPHYLFMDVSDMDRHGTFAKVNPPLKTQEHRTALVQALKDGTIQAVASDHAPFLPQEKRTDDFLNAPSGMPAVELLAPIMLDSCERCVFDYVQAAEMMSKAPAKLLGIDGKKGSLIPGHDADMLIFDPMAETVVSTEKMFTKSRGSALPFEGMKLRGAVRKTIVRGHVVYDGKDIIANKGYGQFVPGPQYKK